MTRFALLSLLIVPLCSGCVAVAAAGVVGVVGTVQYQRNEVEHDFPTQLQETWNATLESLETLKIGPVERELDTTGGRIWQEDLVVRVERHPEGFTRVRVRVGTFHSADHERRAELILQEIEKTIAHEDELKAWAEKVDQLSQPEAAPAKPAEPKR